MNSTFISQNWALLLAAIPGSLVILVGLHSSIKNSAAGKLRLVLKTHRQATNALKSAHGRTMKCDARLAKLHENASRTKPRVLDDAREAAEDAASLEKIAHDKVLVAVNQVRCVIHDEFPPVRQVSLRARYLGDHSAT